MQRERIEDMEVGDHIVLPRGEWHMNQGAQAMYEQAQEVMAMHAGPGPRPQFQVQYKTPKSGPPVDSVLERLR
jgi:hypothetical protein